MSAKPARSWPVISVVACVVGPPHERIMQLFDHDARRRWPWYASTLPPAPGVKLTELPITSPVNASTIGSKVPRFTAMSKTELVERSEEHTPELQSPDHPVCRLL